MAIYGNNDFLKVLAGLSSGINTYYDYRVEKERREQERLAAEQKARMDAEDRQRKIATDLANIRSKESTTKSNEYDDFEGDLADFRTFYDGFNFGDENDFQDFLSRRNVLLQKYKGTEFERLLPEEVTMPTEKYMESWGMKAEDGGMADPAKAQTAASTSPRTTYGAEPGQGFISRLGKPREATIGRDFSDDKPVMNDTYVVDQAARKLLPAYRQAGFTNLDAYNAKLNEVAQTEALRFLTTDAGQNVMSTPDRWTKWSAAHLSDMRARGATDEQIKSEASLLNSFYTTNYEASSVAAENGAKVAKYWNDLSGNKSRYIQTYFGRTVDTADGIMSQNPDGTTTFKGLYADETKRAEAAEYSQAWDTAINWYQSRGINPFEKNIGMDDIDMVARGIVMERRTKGGMDMPSYLNVNDVADYEKLPFNLQGGQIEYAALKGVSPKDVFYDPDTGDMAIPDGERGAIFISEEEAKKKVEEAGKVTKRAMADYGDNVDVNAFELSPMTDEDYKALKKSEQDKKNADRVSTMMPPEESATAINAAADAAMQAPVGRARSAAFSLLGKATGIGPIGGRGSGPVDAERPNDSTGYLGSLLGRATGIGPVSGPSAMAKEPEMLEDLSLDEAEDKQENPYLKPGQLQRKPTRPVFDFVSGANGTPSSSSGFSWASSGSKADSTKAAVDSESSAPPMSEEANKKRYMIEAAYPGGVPADQRGFAEAVFGDSVQSSPRRKYRWIGGRYTDVSEMTEEEIRALVENY